MKTKLLTAVSALVLIIALPAVSKPALADDSGASVGVNANADADLDKGGHLQQDIKEGWEDTKKNVSNAADAVGDAAKRSYYSLKDVLSDKPDTTAKVWINTNTTAEGVIGKDVYDSKGNAVAKIEDVLVGQDGSAKQVIVRDGGFFGLGGKLVALNYGQVMSSTTGGDVINSGVSEPMVEHAVEFDYESDLSANMLSVKDLLDAEVVSNTGKEVADIDNVTFAGAKAQYLVISFNEVLEVGGDTAIIGFNEMEMNRSEDGKVRFQMSASQSAEFEKFSKKVADQG